MERKFLEQLGLDKETVDKVLDAHSAEIGDLKKNAGDAIKDRDSYKTQLDDVATKLKAFEGVDLDALRGEIGTLKNDIIKKDTDYKQQLADRDFQSVIESEVTAAKGKNAKAIMSLLNMGALKTSKNQKEDVAAALKALQESDAYLFEDSKNTTPAKVSTGGEHNEDGIKTTDANAMMNDFIRSEVKGE